MDFFCHIFHISNLRCRYTQIMCPNCVHTLSWCDYPRYQISNFPIQTLKPVCMRLIRSNRKALHQVVFPFGTENRQVKSFFALLCRNLINANATWKFKNVPDSQAYRVILVITFPTSMAPPHNVAHIRHTHSALRR